MEDSKNVPVSKLDQAEQLSCVDFPLKERGLRFEIIDAYCKDGEPQQELIPTPLEEMEDKSSNLENQK